MKIVLAGGSGFLGRALADHFQRAGHEVVSLTRSPGLSSLSPREVLWDARNVGEWAAELDGAAAVVNLAGRSVNCRYNPTNRRLILESRVLSTWALGAAISQCKQPPRAWLNLSTATIYKHTFGPAWDEGGEIAATPEAKDEFSIQVTTNWEQALYEAPTPGTRKVALRTAMVLGNGKNSVFPMLQNLARLGFGGKMGSGRQFVSWIHEADFCRAVTWLIEHEELDGVVNLSSPNPVTNVEMMKLFRNLVHQPWGLPATEWMLKIGAFLLRTETELILKSRRVVPKRLIDSGFKFVFPDLGKAIADLRN
jgi:uncharacterized protein (TIGR01777 family)